MPRTCYLAGPMRGLPRYNFPAFFEAERELRKLGWEVSNPARMDVELDGLDPEDPQPDTSLPLSHYLARDFPAIEKADAFVMLLGWSRSEGVTKHELPHARELGKTVYIYDGGRLEPVEGLLPPLHHESSTGLRLDAGKPRVELVPPSATIAVAEVLGKSAKPGGKYEPRNWEKGMPWSKSYAPAMRHLLAWWEGEDDDQESGMPHLWHALTDIAFLVEWLRTGKGEDDRPCSANAEQGE